jgi:hypothetical protein
VVGQQQESRKTMKETQVSTVKVPRPKNFQVPPDLQCLAAKKLMQQLLQTSPQDFISCGEVNITLLAEYAIDEYSLDHSDGAPVWDWAFEIGQEYEEGQTS